MNKQNIPIFLASDDNYSPFVATTIASILSNTESFIDFFILDGGITDKNQEKIKSLKTQFMNCSIEFINMNDAGLERFPNIKHYSLNTFSRYFIPLLKPDLDKILYLDVDIIVKDDIEKLYNQSLDNYPLGAVLEDFCTSNYSYLENNFPEYKGGSKYFNAGVLLISLNYFRQNNVTHKLIDKTIEFKNILNCPDQDIFNLYFENNFKILDYKFNYMPDHKDSLIKLNKQEAFDAIKKPMILHYTGEKPWKTSLAKMAVDFWEIARLTPFYNELKKNFELNENQTISKLKTKRIKYEILSHIFLGKKKEKYSQKLNTTKEIINSIIAFKKENFSV